MKVLIWIGCYVLHNLITVITDAITDLIYSRVMYYLIYDENVTVLFGFLRGILVAASIGFCWWLATKLCNKYDWYQALKAAAAMNMTPSEYARHNLSEEFLDKLDTLCKKAPIEQVKVQLKSCVNTGQITKMQANILLKEYSWTPGEDK